MIDALLHGEARGVSVEQYLLHEGGRNEVTQPQHHDAAVV